ncbi:MAG: GTP-binding protein [Promethearchaeota archaeon]
MSEDYNYLFKNIVVGDGGCGKTAIVVRFSQGYFLEQYKLTIGVEFAVKTISIKDGIKVKLQIWDTGGQERFQYVRPLYYRGAMGALLLFDLTNRESFDHIPKWIEEVKSNAGEIPMLLVGNKSDLVNERSVSREEAESFAREFQLFYIESSAKDGTGVGDVFAIVSCLMVGTPVPNKYLQGITLTDTNGQVMGQQMQAIPTPAPTPEPSFTPTPEPMEFVEIPTPPPKQELPPAPQQTEEWSVPSTPTPQPTSAPQEGIPSMTEIEASIPPVPKKSEFTDSGPIVFDTPATYTPQQPTVKTSAPPPLVFQPEEEAPKETQKFGKRRKKEKWSPPNAQPVAAPTLFPNAQPAAAPSGFTSKPTPPDKVPFKKETGLEQVSTPKAIDNLLGALHTRPQSSSSSPSMFGGSSSPFKKTSKPTVFIPEVKMEPKKIEPSPTLVPEPAKKKKEKRQRGKKKNKSITICSNCGAILSSAYKFCNKCGSSVK